MDMVQQINLYRPALSLKRWRTPLGHLRLAASLVVVTVLAWPAWAGWGLWKVQRQMHEVTALLADAKQQLASAEQEVLLQDPELRGVDEAAMRKELEELEAQRQTWHGFVPSETVRYSHYLAAFSRRQVPGLWLTRIKLSNNGTSVKLEGQSTDPALVPAFVARLGYESVLAGVTFRGLHMFLPEDEKETTAGYVSFVIATEPNPGTGL